MARKGLPNFIIYQPNKKEFHICLEVQGKFLRWCSYYPPTLDVRYSRDLTRIDDMPLNKKPRKQVFDEGTYTITKADTKESIEDKITEGLKAKSFSFTLNGKKLRGRFAIKKKSTHAVLQKFKDKFAIEEDVLSDDLARTISTMVPNYDERKVNLDGPIKRTQQRKPEPEPELQPVELPPVEEPTAEKKIGNVEYHFAFYTAKDEPEICLVTNSKTEVIVLKKVKAKWVMQPSPGRTELKKKDEFVEHASALYESSNR